jgi:hypothetical protein
MWRTRATAALLGGASLLLGLAAPAVAGAASDQTILQAGVVHASDVPATWQAGAQNDVGARQFVGSSCNAIRSAYAAAHNGPHLLSSQFSDPTSGGTALAENIVFAFKSPVAATKFLAGFQTANAHSCLQAAVQKQAGRAGRVTSVSRIANLQALGNGAVGYELLVRFQGISSPLVVDYLGVRVGRGVAAFTFTNVGSAVPSGHEIVNAVIARLKSAGA